MALNPLTISITDDISIPTVGFGTYLIAPELTADAVKTALGIGYRHIDTAEMYANEVGVGEGMRRAFSESGLVRSDVFVTTKLWPGYAPWGDRPKNKAATVKAFDVSLAQLALDYIDLYLIHSPHGGEERLEQWKALVELKAAGKVRSIGVSNYHIRHLEEIKASGLPMPEVNQIELHPWSQKPDLVAYLRDHNILPIAYSSLAPLSTWRVDPGQDSAKKEMSHESSQIIANMAAKYNVTGAQLLLRWGVQNNYPVLPKSLNPARMRENFDIFSFSIDESDMAVMSTIDRGDGLAWSVGDPTLVK